MTSQCINPDAVLLTWHSRPARCRPAVVAATAAYVALVALALLAGFRSPVLAVGGALLVLLAGAELLAPARCTLTRDGAERQSLWARRSLSWGAVRAAAVNADGVWLSPVAEQGLAWAWRGLYLPLGGLDEATRRAVLALVDELASARRRPEGSGDGCGTSAG
jgi:hypothetical protein